MKKSNKKGFVLLETLIVAVFVVTMFVFIYRNTVPMAGEYEKMANFEDVDSVYAIHQYKQMLLRYGDMNYIDTYLEKESYLDISDCANTNIYKNADYCKKIQKNLSISSSDSIFITKYNVSLFRTEVKNDEKFDSGKLSGFRDYMNTVYDVESFYDPGTDSEIINGTYRIFITRTVTNADKSKTLKYANLGVYTGKYTKYNAGEEVIFNPGTGDKKFYVLKNSSTTENKVTLILSSGMGASIKFNESNFTSEGPTNVLTQLMETTKNWTNVTPLTLSDGVISDDGYTVSYLGYRARLLNTNDIYDFLGCKIDDKNCFDPTNAFAVNFDSNRLNFLVDGLNTTSGYWTANTVTGSGVYAWVIKKGIISPEKISAAYDFKPVIVVEKSKLVK